MSVRTALVGVTGALGQELFAALAELARSGELELEPPVVCSTGKTVGEPLEWVGEDEEVVIEPFQPAAVRGVSYALVAVPEAAAKEIVASLRQQGVATIDASRARRQDAPMFFDAKPPSLAGQNVVALPSAEALLLGRIVHALAEFEPTRVTATILRPASGAGQAGVGELAESTGLLLNGQEPPTPKLGHRLAFNLVPQAGPFDGADSEAERDLANELPRLVGRPIAVASTIAYAPWFYGHFATVTLAFARPVSPEAVREKLETAPRVKVLDDPAQSVYPMPALATGDEAVLAGRVRADPTQPNAVQLVLAMDAVRATAVLAVEALASLVRAREAH